MHDRNETLEVAWNDFRAAILTLSDAICDADFLVSWASIRSRITSVIDAMNVFEEAHHLWCSQVLTDAKATSDRAAAATDQATAVVDQAKAEVDRAKALQQLYYHEMGDERKQLFDSVWEMAERLEEKERELEKQERLLEQHERHLRELEHRDEFIPSNN
jgi:hypothetical protein